MKSSWRNAYARGVIIVLAFVFGLSGIGKLFNPSEAELALESLDVPNLAAKIVVSTVTFIELALAGMLLLRTKVGFVLKVVQVMLVGFTVYLYYLSTLANPPSCGCLGLTGIFENNRLAVFGMIRNIMLLVMAASAYTVLCQQERITMRVSPVNPPVELT